MRVLNVAALGLVSVLLIVGCDPKNDEETLEGTWEGKLTYPGFESRIVFVIDARAGGTLETAMLRPDENDAEVPVSRTVFDHPHVELHIASIGAWFEGVLNARHEAIAGQWHHGRWSQPLVLKRITEIVKVSRPQTPVPPYPYDEQSVTFVNPDAGAKLAGTLTLPRTGGRAAAVILISGVGAHDRDYSILRHRPFLVLADYLTRRGIAVLRFDDRGVGRSTGDRAQATSEDYARDVLAGVRCLMGHARIDPNRIGLIGHSEGGTIAALAAAASRDVAFIVMMGAPGLPGRQYNLQFEESTARAMGLSEEAITAKRRFQERVLSVVVEEDDPVAAEAALRRLYQESYASMPEDKIQAAIARLTSPWFRFNATHDPAETLEGVDCPVLAIIGGKDVQVPAEGNLAAIRRGLDRGGNGDYRVEEIRGLNHFFQTAATGSPVEYGRIAQTIAPSALALVTDWVLRHTR